MSLLRTLFSNEIKYARFPESELIMSSRRNYDVVESVQDDNILDAVRRECLGPCSDSKKLKNSILGFLPIVHWIRDYNIKEYLVSDIIAGIITGVLHVPQGRYFEFQKRKLRVEGIKEEDHQNIFNFKVIIGAKCY